MIPSAPLNKKRPKARIDGAARKRICQYAQLHPDLRQADIAAVFNVERSTVSKILKQKVQWLAFGHTDDDGHGGAPNGGGHGRTPSLNGTSRTPAGVNSISNGTTGANGNENGNGTGNGNGTNKARASAATHGRKLSSATTQLRESAPAGAAGPQPIVPNGLLYNGVPQPQEGHAPTSSGGGAGEHSRTSGTAGLPFLQRPPPY